MICIFCGKEFKHGKQIGGHIIRCKNNPNKIIGNKLTGKNLTTDHKNNVSIGRRKYLDENPDKIPYLLNHSSKKSWPEKFFEELIKNAGITGWVYNYPNGRYRYDFAFPELKIDIEIDGGTHQQENVIKMDKERDEFSTNDGWRVLRIDARNLYDEDRRIIVLYEIIKFLNDDRIFGLLECPKKIKKQSLPRGEKLKLINDEKYKLKVEQVRSSNINFLKFGWVQQVAEIVGITPQRINRWMKKYLPDIYENAFKSKRNKDRLQILK